ncbi:FAD-dependent monooxygenase [Streptomyces sp. NPDC048172]|uniref:FAD-dependent monooxygenase n=1 Tax=Streptomyces sp. NPDC048172 TaxID=3365505 RepID=UPI00371355B1
MKAVVVGGGIGGLAAAVALHARGWDIEVHERAEEFTGIGAGLAVQPNALRALDALDLGDAVRERAATEPPLGIRHAGGRWLIRNDTAELERRYGRWVMLPRAELIDLLRARIPEGALRPGSAVTDVRPDGTVRYRGGESAGDLVVGADGIRSVTRQAVLPDAPAPRYAGYSTWRFIAPPLSGAVAEGSVETWGRGERFGYAPLPDGRVYCYVMANAPQGHSNGSPEDEMAALRSRFARWHEPIPSLLAAAEPGAVLRHDTYELPDLPTFVGHRTALLGDAAHAMTPNLGQGACQAIEDAAGLAAALDRAGGDTAAGLDAYDRARRPRAQMIVRRSRRVGGAAQWSSPALTALRNMGLRMTPGSSFARSLAPVIGEGTVGTVAGARS